MSLYLKKSLLTFLLISCGLLALQGFTKDLALSKNFKRSKTNSAVSNLQNLYPPSVLKASKAIWNIINEKSNENKTSGNGFFISPKLFVTNFHVAYELLNSENTFLQQDSHSGTLQIKRVLALSAESDLALLEIEEKVSFYLPFRTKTLENPDEELFLVAYLDQKLHIIEKTSPLLEYSDSLNFFVNYSDLRGASGSPILNSQGEISGVLFKAIDNFIGFINQDRLQDFIEKNQNLPCKNQSLTECFQKAFDSLHSKAETEIRQNQYILTRIYLEVILTEGKQKEVEQEKTEQNKEQTFHWLQKSAEQDFAPAQSFLALLYFKGIETKKDTELALFWVTQSANQDFPPAKELLAEMHVHGEGAEKNEKLAFFWRKQSAEQGFVLSQYRLSKMYLYGIGAEQDDELAFFWMKQAAKQNYAPAQEFLAEMYLKGLGIQKNDRLAFFWIQKSAEQGFSPAQYELAWMHLYGIGTPQSEDLASQWLEKYAENKFFPPKFYLMQIRVKKSFREIF